jgi:L-cysteine S-thiosulfotransferase
MVHRALPCVLFPGVLLAAALASCASPSPPAPPPLPGGWVLPAGDPEAGRQAFLELQCNVCHAVKGGGFPEPSIYPPLPFVLGERWEGPPDRLWLATCLINPAHEEIPGNRVSFLGAGQVYRMKDYGDSMTVGQMVDLVEYLETLAAEGR